VRPILEYIESWWDPYTEGQINALDRMQYKFAKFAHQRNDSNRETLAQRKKITRTRAYTGERAWKAISDRLQKLHYQSRVDVDRKIRSIKQRTDIEKIPL
jgi:IS5 family transposase